MNALISSPRAGRSKFTQLSGPLLYRARVALAIQNLSHDYDRVPSQYQAPILLRIHAICLSSWRVYSMVASLWDACMNILMEPLTPLYWFTGI